jgi:phage RecT family recombinase
MSANQLVAQYGNTISTPEFQSKLAAALPANISVDRFTRVLLTAWQINPDILQCDKTSVYMAVLTAAQQGLMPDGREGAIVKFGNRAQFMPMVAGVIKRFAEAEVKAYAGSVYERDSFAAWNDDTGQHIEHRPAWFGDRGEWIGCYAVGHVNGTTYVEIADIAELHRIRSKSRGAVRSDGTVVGPWADWPERMGQKSMLHRLGRRVPMLANNDAAERLARTVAADRDEYDGTDAVHPAEPPETASSATAQPPRQTRPRVFDAVATVVPEPPTGQPDETPPNPAPSDGFPEDF